MPFRDDSPFRGSFARLGAHRSDDGDGWNDENRLQFRRRAHGGRRGRGQPRAGRRRARNLRPGKMRGAIQVGRESGGRSQGRDPYAQGDGNRRPLLHREHVEPLSPRGPEGYEDSSHGEQWERERRSDHLVARRNRKHEFVSWQRPGTAAASAVSLQFGSLVGRRAANCVFHFRDLSSGRGLHRSNEPRRVLLRGRRTRDDPLADGSCAEPLVAIHAGLVRDGSVRERREFPHHRATTDWTRHVRTLPLRWGIQQAASQRARSSRTRRSENGPRVSGERAGWLRSWPDAFPGMVTVPDRVRDGDAMP